jgi:hypothetical protein
MMTGSSHLVTFGRQRSRSMRHFLVATVLLVLAVHAGAVLAAARAVERVIVSP